MFCPACNTQNDAMAMHCFQCRTQLIRREQDRSPEVKALVKNMNSRIYGGVGFGVFLILGFVVLQNAALSILMGVIGGALGRYIARQEEKGR